MGNDGDRDFVADDGGYGEADAFDGDGALFDDVAGERIGNGETETPVGIDERFRSDGLESNEGACAVYVALYDMAAERRACGSREFEVDDRLGMKEGECCAGYGFGSEVSGEAWRKGVRFDVESGETDSADGDAVACVEAVEQVGRCGYGDARCSCGGGDGEEGSGSFDEAGEHRYRV
jgi:hypothetical protein